MRLHVNPNCSHAYIFFRNIPLSHVSPSPFDTYVYSYIYIFIFIFFLYIYIIYHTRSVHRCDYYTVSQLKKSIAAPFLSVLPLSVLSSRFATRKHGMRNGTCYDKYKFIKRILSVIKRETQFSLQQRI